MTVDTQAMIAHGRANDSTHPVTTARYMVEIVMNEDEPDLSEGDGKMLLSDAIQQALDAPMSPFTPIRYDALIFEVVSREVLDVAPAGEAADPLPFIVGMNTVPPWRLRQFATEAEAAAFIDTLEGAKDGRYYIDDMTKTEEED